MSILAHRLMRLIETHAEPLAEALEAKISTCERCTNYSRVSSDELKTLVGGIYGQLGQWLVTKTEEDIERRYTMIGTRRAEQCVPVSQLLWCIVLVKENLWEYLKNNESMENTAQIFGELELMQMVDQFFDRAMYHAVRGHEKVREARLAELTKSRPA
ncbi:MAG: hypothetical protein ABSD13_11935 [Candidatus Korobacteraceae bacterium]